MNERTLSDPVTGLRNRRYLYGYLEQREREADPSHPAEVSLVLLELEGFLGATDPTVRDTELRRTAHALLPTLEGAGPDGDGAFLARYAGSVLMAVLPATGKQNALQLALSLRRAAQADRPEAPATPAVGVATYPGDAGQPHGLLEACDAAAQAAGTGIGDAADLEGGETAAVTQGGFPCPRLVGRDREMGQLREAIARESSGVVAVAGSAGAGKTRLLQDLVDEIKDLPARTTLSIHCERYQTLPFATITTALNDLVIGGELDPALLRTDLGPEQIELLSSVLPAIATDSPKAPEASGVYSPEARRAIFQSLTQVMRNLATSSSLILVFDDAHWIDEGTLSLTSHLASVPGFSTLVILAYRPTSPASTVPLPGDDGAPAALTGFLANPPGSLPPPVRIELLPLPGEDTRRMVRAILPRVRVPSALDEQLVARASGNPLYIEATLKALLGEGRIQLVSKRWTVAEDLSPDELPASLDEALERQLSSVGESVRQVLTCAAAIGSDFDVALVSQISGRTEEQVWGDLDQAEKQQAIRRKGDWSDDQFEFTSRALHESSINTAPVEETRAMQAAVAEAAESRLVQGKENELLASKFMLQVAYYHRRMGNTNRAAPYEEQIRARSRMLYSPDEAASYPRPRRLSIPTADTPLDDQQMSKMDDMLRFFTGLAKSIQLYPPGSRQIERAMLELRHALTAVFVDLPSFTVSATEQDLLVNGRVVARQLRGSAAELWKLLRDHYVNSVTLTRDVRDSELQVFLSELVMVDKTSFHPDFWDDLFARHSVEHIAVDQRIYVVAGPGGGDGSGGSGEGGTRPGRLGGGPVSPAPLLDDNLTAMLDEIIGADRPFRLPDELKAELPGLLDDLLRNHRSLEVDKIADNLMKSLDSPDPLTRRQAADFLSTSISRSQAFSQIDMAPRIQGELVKYLEAESDGEAFRNLADTAAGSATAFLKEGNYTNAQRLVYCLRRRGQDPETPPDVRRFADQTLRGLLTSGFFDLLVADLRSPRAQRQVAAARVLTEFGHQAVESLLEVLSTVKDLRIRRMAAEAMAAIGDDAYSLLSKQLIVEQLEDEQWRGIVEVLDVFLEAGRDILPELERALFHNSRPVRLAALKLSRRVNPARVEPLLLRALTHEGVGVVRDVVNQIGKLRLTQFAAEILRLLRETSYDEVRKECCLTLGKLKHAEAVPDLRRLLERRRAFSSASAQPLEIRTLAAWALSQIDTEEARTALKRAARDPSIKTWLSYSSTNEGPPVDSGDD